MEFIAYKQKIPLISSFLEETVGQTEETAIQFLMATSWELEEAINLSLSCEEIWHSAPEPDSFQSDSRLSSLYRAPENMFFKGSFEDAKTTSSKEDLWLLVNLQSTTDFSSYSLNLDLWSDEVVSQTIKSSFLLLQVYDHTEEGKKISTFYKIDYAPPVVLLIDPITGQKMRSWRGVIEVQSFLEDLMKYSDAGPHKHMASLTRNNQLKKREKTCLPRNDANQDMANFNDKSAEAKTLLSHKKEETCSSSNYTPSQVVSPSWGPEFEEETCSPSIYGSWDFEHEESSEGEEEEEEEEAYPSDYTPPLVHEFEKKIILPKHEEETCFEESAEVKEKETCSSINNTSCGHEFEETMSLPEHEDESCLKEFPVLTEEPKGDCDRSLVCSLCVRFPDGRRKQRKFLKSEPIQLLWSFCYSHMEESEKKAFKLMEAIPGATKTLDYGVNVTFDQSGLAYSLILVTWE